MKNKKILKSLAAMAVGTVMVAGSFSLAACGHKHTWGEDYGKDGASGHYRICTGCDEHSETEPHTLNNNGECTVCHWTSAPSTTVAVASVSLNKNTLSLKVGVSETLTATVAPANATNKNVIWAVTAGDAVTVSASGAVTAVKEGTATVTVTTQDGDKTATCTVTVTNNGGGEENPPAELSYKLFKIEELGEKDTSVSAGPLGTGMGLELSGPKTTTVSENDAAKGAYTSTYNGQALSLTKSISTGGAIKGSNSIKVTTTEKTTVYVYAYSGGSDARSFALYESDNPSSNTGYLEGTAQGIGNGSGAALGVAKFEIDANLTRYIGSTGSSISIYAIGVVTGGNVAETVVSSGEAKEATCEEEGAIAYKLTNFGRYCTDAELKTAVAPHAIVTAKKAHTYTYNQSALDADLPTDTTEKTIAVTCSVCNDTQNVTLPNLKNSVYVRTENTDGTVTYKYTADCGAVITFKAAAAAQEGVVGTYTYTVDANKNPVCNQSSDANVTAVSIVDFSFSAAHNAGTFKFGKSADVVTLTLYAEAGTTITVNVSGYSGSIAEGVGADASIVVSATGATKSSGAETTTFPGANAPSKTPTDGTVVYTVSDAGKVTITLKRGIAKSALLTKIELVVAKSV